MSALKDFVAKKTASGQSVLVEVDALDDDRFANAPEVPETREPTIYEQTAVVRKALETLRRLTDDALARLGLLAVLALFGCGLTSCATLDGVGLDYGISIQIRPKAKTEPAAASYGKEIIPLE